MNECVAMNPTSSGYWSVLLCTLFISGVITISLATNSDQSEVQDHEFQAPDGLDVDREGHTPQFETDTTEPHFKRQFKTAEIADAVLGTELSGNSAGIESLIPKSLKGSLSGVSAPSTPCGDEKCKAVLVFQDTNEQQGPADLAVVHIDSGMAEGNNTTETAKTYKVNCDKRSVIGLENFTVQVLNASQDLMEFLNANSTECSLVLFYTTWCQFSANLAPHFNALPRVFPTMTFLALDASQHSSLSTRFGTVAVPNILLFQGAKPMARFNHTDRTLETLTSFIANQTGFEAIPDQTVSEGDHSGPLPSVPVKSIDWLFVFSVLFISGFILYAILRTDSIRLLIPGQEHEHQE
ncbi:thioredoxin domain-containing protein 15 [Electrophorus electricus]|uniref:thioredoxin domain-containing protein 15 n=1 Tax=Electrophorus electricus TaxID=8005 RepID=UPI0015D0A6E5|nr:thioredoxin domain-containing protein 15 [Electrophorus electricus]